MQNIRKVVHTEPIYIYKYLQNMCSSHLSYVFQNLLNPSIRLGIKHAKYIHCSVISTSSRSIHPSASQKIEQLSSDFYQLKFKKHDSEVKANTVWLRHHCRCSQCFNTSTHQRIQIPSSLKETTQIRNFDVHEDELTITWNDDHVSNYKYQWLQENLKGNFASHPLQSESAPTKMNSHNTIEISPLRLGIKYTDFMSPDNKGLIELLTNIKTFGYGVIVDAPPNVESTNKAILRISHPQTTIFGDFYEFSNDMSHADTAYTSDYVHLHTDTTYFSEPIGLQVFHCLYHDGEGGLNSIVDGFQIAKEMQEENPKFYNTLTQSLVPWQYVDPQKHFFYHVAPIFSHNQYRQLECIRYNPHDMALLNTVQQDMLPEFYESLIALSEKIESNPIWLKLHPGVILFLDNWRCLHGRNKFTGRRKMCGSYISRSDWLSKNRVFTTNSVQ